MNNLSIFKNSKFGEVRTVTIEGKDYFVASDVAKALGYARPADAVSAHCLHTAKRSIGVQTGVRADGTPAMQNVEMNCIPIGDICRLVANSELPGAPAYESWIFDEVIPAIHKTGSYSISGSDAEARQMRNQAMLINARVKAFKLVMETAKDKALASLSPIALQLYEISALEAITGQRIDYRPETEKTYSATEIAQELDIPAQTLGKLAVGHNLKTPENGIWVMDKSPYSSKQVESFRYNQKGRETLIALCNQRASANGASCRTPPQLAADCGNSLQ